MSSSSNKTVLKKNRINWCNNQADMIHIKQKQLDILIEQYGQIVSNYDALIKPYERKIEKEIATEADLAAKELYEYKREQIIVQINLYKEQLDLCEKRLTALYAILTVLGEPDKDVGSVYVTIEVAAPGYVSSF
jgi:hypothetical protein